MTAPRPLQNGQRRGNGGAVWVCVAGIFAVMFGSFYFSGGEPARAPEPATGPGFPVGWVLVAGIVLLIAVVFIAAVVGFACVVLAGQVDREMDEPDYLTEREDRS